MRIAFYILIFFLSACTVEESNRLNTNHKVNSNLEFNSSNEFDVDVPFRKNVSLNTDVIRIFNDSISASLDYCSCLLNNGVLEIKISKNTGFVGEDLIIKANDSVFHMAYNHFGDVSSEEFEAYAIRQELEINTNNFVANNILIGQVFFQGLGFCELIRNPEFRVELKGKFKCRIENK